MSWTKKYSDHLLILSSFLVGLIVFEVGFSFLGRNQGEFYQWDRRYMLFKGEIQSPVFKNIDTFFAYQPNQNIESTTYYYVNGQWQKEYDYFIPTNNFGLAQTTPTVPNRRSILILGDSFTEGQGVYPWFEGFREKFESSGFQLINGGILGTGFQSWELLHDHLIASGINVTKLVVVFISGDYSRGVWNMPMNTLECIRNPSVCLGDENFYGKPEAHELSDFLERLRIYREGRLGRSDTRGFKDFLKSLLPGTSAVYAFLSGRFSSENQDANFTKNSLVIERLVGKYGSNVLFVHVPQKDEAISGRINPMGVEVAKKIRGVNGVLFDGHSKCGFGEGDYFVNDGHPNQVGYEKLSKCVSAAIQSSWEPMEAADLSKH